MPGSVFSLSDRDLHPVQAMGRGAVLVVIGVALLVAAAKVQVPFWPVPMTLQTIAVFAVGTVYGARLGVVTVAAYLVLGAAGLPVFAGTPARGIGLAYMTGPTAGYIAGFLVAGWLAGWLGDRGWDRRAFTAGLAMTFCVVVILGLGWARLALLIGPERALDLGVVPFAPAEALKIAAVTLLMPLAWKVRAGRPGA
ncbi:biotin transporter BioY [Caenispirillum bisanense]|uniref:Biotin transporter n=1 Tax=Caenispirillum bisanense TaxID=414052 RepID=A0A286GFE0_9PROT|nr:biotin transporter BioY [Caenispirillum bisanense]SOD93946.1 biotin transport system substrate-specific component [Caenispirillum bisanense]